MYECPPLVIVVGGGKSSPLPFISPWKRFPPSFSNPLWSREKPFYFEYAPSQHFFGRNLSIFIFLSLNFQFSCWKEKEMYLVTGLFFSIWHRRNQNVKIFGLSEVLSINSVNDLDSKFEISFNFLDEFSIKRLEN